jgi:hypothetical protein
MARELDGTAIPQTQMSWSLSLVNSTQRPAKERTPPQPCIHCHASSACLALLILVVTWASRHPPNSPVDIACGHVHFKDVLEARVAGTTSYPAATISHLPPHTRIKKRHRRFKSPSAKAITSALGQALFCAGCSVVQIYTHHGREKLNNTKHASTRAFAYSEVQARQY